MSLGLRCTCVSHQSVKVRMRKAKKAPHSILCLVLSRSQTTINISAWGSILKSGVDLPWSGTAYVKCDGIKKVLIVPFLFVYARISLYGGMSCAHHRNAPCFTSKTVFLLYKEITSHCLTAFLGKINPELQSTSLTIPPHSALNNTPKALCVTILLVLLIVVKCA